MGDTFITLAMVMMAVALASFVVMIVLILLKRKSAAWFLIPFVIFFVLFFVFLIVGGNMNKESSTNSEPSTSEEDVAASSSYVSPEAEMILVQMTEDVAKQISNYPATVDFNTFAWGFWRNERVYAVQGIFTCTNAFGVEEEYTLRLICEASDDYSQISVKEVYLNDELIKYVE